MMQTGSVTTPFGRRPMTLALVRQQTALAEIKPGKTADKWKLFRDASAAMKMLGIQSSSLAVLDALLSFYPGNELRQDAQLIVFPSNVQLALRAHGMAGATLRRHIAILVEAGLIRRKDSANGKRYARKDGTGKIESAFGFDLSPLLLRSEELAQLAQQVVADRASLRKARENLTICRRDVRKLITAAREEGADGDWSTIEANYMALVGRIPRAPVHAEIREILDDMLLLRDDIINHLKFQDNPENNGSNAAHDEQHIQNSNTDIIIESEPRFEKDEGQKLTHIRKQVRKPIKSFPLEMTLKACPAIRDYAPGGAIANWRDLTSAAGVVRSMLGIGTSTYQEACDVMGPDNAATVIACVLERANFINSPGAYLRDLTRKAECGEFSTGPMIMALWKVTQPGTLKAG